MKRGYHYTESGLSNVWLVSGYTIRKSKYGRGVSIHNVDGLHHAIAKALANKARLTGAEVRFLRKEMGLSQRGLGELVGVTDQAVALWERTGRVPKTADRLLRLIYLERENGNLPIVKFSQKLNDLDLQGATEQIFAKEAKGGWVAQAAA